MKKKFKFLSIILIVLLLISALPLAAFADEIEDTEITDEAETFTDTVAEQEETEQGNYVFSLPEDDENTRYERISKNVIKVTVYPNVTEEDETTLIVPPIDGHINFTDPFDDATPMVVPPINDEIIFDGDGSSTYPADTYISSSSKATNYGSVTEASISNSKYFFISYPMPYIPEYATIIEATLNLKYRYQSTESATVYAHKVNFDWNENTLTWNLAAQHTGMGLDQTFLSSVTITDTQGTSLTTPQNVSIDILDAAEAWHIDETENHGIALKSSGKSVAIKKSEAAYDY